MNSERMFGQWKSGLERFSSQKSTNERKQLGSAQSSRTSQSSKDEADKRGFGQGANSIYGKRPQSHLPHSKWRRQLDGDKWSLDQGAGAIYGERAHLQTPHSKWHRKKEKEDTCITKQLETLAQELCMTGESRQDIIETASRELRNAREINSRDQNRIKELESNLEELKKVVFLVKTVKNNEHDMEETKSRIQDLHRAADENKNNIQRQRIELANKEKEIADLNEQLKSKKESEQMLNEQLKTARSEKDMARTRAAEESKNDILPQTTEFANKEKEISNLNEQLTAAGKNHQALLKSKEESIQRLNNELEMAKRQQEFLLTRLSQLAGAKLSLANQAIIEMTNPNRPIQIALAEQFSDLFDNLWIDVWEELSGTYKMSERDSIQTLLQILQDSYDYCKDISSKRYLNTLAELTLLKRVEPNETPSQVQGTGKNNSDVKATDSKEITLGEIQKLQTLLDSPSSSSAADNTAVDLILEKIGLNVTCLSDIKKILKSSLEGTSVIVQESFWKQRREDPDGQKEVLECTKPFMMKCVHICWLMVGQDPPVYLRFSDKCEDKFNKDIYREYMASGKMLDFVVWPAIFLHENGPILQKGVAQPISKK
ncbi:early endosome antigen 1-like [Magallana gigas]|uniref:early endosome antigen 1-like n=1 Tax=Magallana gigas TaxID=29159 RepID=UPI003341A8A3